MGRRVAELRRTQGLTQAAFAEEAGVSLQYAQRVEAGEENLTIESLVKLAHLLRVPVASLFEAPTTRRAPPGRPRKA
ncbi:MULTISPECIES: helix-turn-helix transcriptional regulator [Myxococcaceae]|uniref:helix-turn-helix domain-containing protein n=1 Tax=Myxococcaceae TaxID=31 RepID=UPI00188FD544|nr:helix-turn-helix transcriptional regulator [Simulacricoccus sp. 17bor-14]